MKSPSDGKYYPLECNPRLGTSFVLFTPEDGVFPLLQKHLDSSRNTNHPTAFQKPLKNQTLQQSKPDSIMEPSRKQIFYLLYILWEIVSDPLNRTTWKQNVAILVQGHEAVLSVVDPLPIFALNFLQMPALLVHYMLHNKPWNVVDYNIGTLKTV
ncbi:hypothetical protein ACOMHN_021829 [Nucella lapillus]